MAQEFDNTNRGVLFKNDEKETDNHPDYTGKLDVRGEEFYLSAWIKTSKKGQKFMSLSVKAAQQQEQKRGAKKPEDDSIPF
jgi:uncharacterized protein (DUF736 family)